MIRHTPSIDDSSFSAAECASGAIIDAITVSTTVIDIVQRLRMRYLSVLTSLEEGIPRQRGVHPQKQWRCSRDALPPARRGGAFNTAHAPYRTTRAGPRCRRGA